MSTYTAFLNSRIELLRVKLLDLTRNNPLISARLSPRSTSIIRIVDEIPELVYERLNDQQRFTFASLPDLAEDPPDEQSQQFQDRLAAFRAEDREYNEALSKIDELDESSENAAKTIERALKDRLRALLGMPPRKNRAQISLADHAKFHGINPSFELPSEDAASIDGRHEDKQLQTLLLPEDLLRRLNAISDKEKTWVQETGIQVLKAAFGLLEWIEPVTNEKTLSPLVLLPVSIEKKRTDKGTKFHLKSTGDDPKLNQVIKEKFRKDFGIELPEFDAEQTLSDYFESIRSLRPNQVKLTLRRQLIVGVFPSAREAMYVDLNPESHDFSSNDIVSRLFLGTENSTESPFGDDYPVDEPIFESKVPYLVLDADSSQVSALIDVAQGKTLALEGPPGTGKSQTIVNIIANAIATGKKVLFVAEKTAALEVVRKRLDEAGLAQFVLSLSAERTSREAVISSVRDRIQNKINPQDNNYEASAKHYRFLRDQLQTHLNALRQPIGRTGLSVHDVLGRNIKLRAENDDSPVTLGVAHAKSLTSLHITQINEAIATAEKLQVAYDKISGRFSAWFPQQTPLSPIEIDDLLARTKAAANHASTLSNLMSDERIRSLLPDHLAALDSIVAWLTEFQGNDDLDFAWIRRALCKGNPRSVVRSHRRWRIKKLQDDFVCNEIGNTDRITALDNITNAIALAADLQLSTIDDRSISAKRNSTNSDLRKLQAAIETYRPVFTSIPALESCPLFVLAQLASLIESTSDEVLDLRNDENTLSSRLGALTELSRTASGLISEKKSLEQELHGTLDSKSAAIDRLYRVFASAGFFSKWSSDFRLATAELETHFNHSYIDSKTAVQFLSEIRRRIDEWNSKWRELTGSSAFQKLFATDDGGPLTPFDHYQALAHFLRQIDLSLPGLDLIEFRQPIKNAPVPVLRAISNLFRSSPPDTLIAPHSFSELNIDSQNLRTRAARINDQLDQLDSLRGRLFGLTDLSRLRRLQRKLIRTEKNERLSTGWFPELFTTTEKADRHLPSLPDRRGVDTYVLSTLIGHEAYASWLLQRLEDNDAEEIRLKLLDLTDELRNYEENIGYLRQSQSLEALIAHADSKFNSTTYKELSSAMARAATDKAGLEAASDIAALVDALDNLRLKSLFDTWRTQSPRKQSFAKFLETTVFYELARICFNTYRDELTGYNGEKLDDLRKKFRAADIAFRNATRNAVASRVDNEKRIPMGIGRGPKSGFTEDALLRNEIAKSKRWISPRELTRRAGSALLEYKPCWMMSPLAVAQYLQRDMQFDLCVIDEASQMPPEDAIGALMRCKQAVVVGDTNQLPPTNFFKRVFDEVENDDTAVVEESILELANSTFESRRRLRWHYRSRHSSLIEFSNRQIYKDLQVLPDARDSRDGMGVSVQFIDGFYNAGTNFIEAKAMVDAIVRFMKEQPHRSLGVAVMNQKQQQLIRELLDKAYEDCRWVSEYIEKWESAGERLEPFLLRNLENIQGDERDVIFIGTVYGRERAGAPVMQRFGPINGPAGRRRLNVLVTRAKEQIVTFTSMRPSDIVADENGNPGAFLFKNWLEYSYSGQMIYGSSTGREPDSDFEQFVIDQINSMGFIAVPQVGVSGYYIDIGVKHSLFPGDFLLGVECDGAAFHSSKSARDRDRIREAVLEGLGWKLHRIWSTDWFRNASREVERLRQVLLSTLEIKKALFAEPGHFVETAGRPQPVQPRADIPSPTHGRSVNSALVDNANDALDARQTFVEFSEYSPTFSNDAWEALISDYFVAAILFEVCYSSEDDGIDFEELARLSPSALKSVTSLICNIYDEIRGKRYEQIDFGYLAQVISMLFREWWCIPTDAHPVCFRESFEIDLENALSQLQNKSGGIQVCELFREARAQVDSTFGLSTKTDALNYDWEDGLAKALEHGDSASWTSHVIGMCCAKMSDANFRIRQNCNLLQFVMRLNKLRLCFEAGVAYSSIGYEVASLAIVLNGSPDGEFGWEADDIFEALISDIEATAEAPESELAIARWITQIVHTSQRVRSTPQPQVFNGTLTEFLNSRPGRREYEAGLYTDAAQSGHPQATYEIGRYDLAGTRGCPDFFSDVLVHQKFEELYGLEKYCYYYYVFQSFGRNFSVYAQEINEAALDWSSYGDHPNYASEICGSTLADSMDIDRFRWTVFGCLEPLELEKIKNKVRQWNIGHAFLM